MKNIFILVLTCVFIINEGMNVKYFCRNKYCNKQISISVSSLKCYTCEEGKCKDKKVTTCSANQNHCLSLAGKLN